MACNSCAKPYTLFRKERGCPSCGFSYCSKCLNHTIFVNKLNSNAKVCTKCSTHSNVNKSKSLQPPDAYYKRIGEASNNTNNNVEQDIERRLQSLKDDRNNTAKEISNDIIKERLQTLKGVQPTTSDIELQARLANLRGVPFIDTETKPIICTPDLRSEQEQADNLLKHYLEEAKIDKQYKDGFDKNIEDIEQRVLKLKGDTTKKPTSEQEADSDSEDEEKQIEKLMEQVKVESSLPVDVDGIISSPRTLEELPFCEICNEDAKMRCLGCRYLFCKRCFMEHKDDDDGCDKYEPYEPSRT